MKTIYVNNRSDLSTMLNSPLNEALQIYRVRTECNCTPPHNKRDGLLLTESDILIARFVRCKSCRKGGMI